MAPEYLILMRLVQLTLGSLIGLICIYFGYKLFAQIPVNVTNDGHFKMPQIGEAKLKVAPGIFFAILGAAIVYFSIDRPISINSTPQSTVQSSDEGKISSTENINGGSSPVTAPSPPKSAPSPPAPSISYSQQGRPRP